MADRPVFLYTAVYDNAADALSDFDAVFDLHAAKAIGTFDAAVIMKEDDKVQFTRPRSRPSTEPGPASRSGPSSASSSPRRSSAPRSSAAPPGV